MAHAQYSGGGALLVGVLISHRHNKNRYGKRHTGLFLSLELLRILILYHNVVGTALHDGNGADQSQASFFLEFGDA